MLNIARNNFYKKSPLLTESPQCIINSAVSSAHQQYRSPMKCIMKKWLLTALILLFLSGCSFDRVWKWIDEMDFERDDQTINIVRFIVK
jgi:hypothetical protein